MITWRSHVDPESILSVRATLEEVGELYYVTRYSDQAVAS